MAYKLPYSSMPAHHFLQENMANPQIYFQEEIDYPLSWPQNIDPTLRDQQSQSVTGWQQEQQPLQRWVQEPEKTLFITENMQNFRPQEFNASFGPTSSLPQAVRSRMDSPTPSQDPSSTCSSARSPRAEIEYYAESYYSPQTSEDYTMHASLSHIHQGLPEYWREQPQSHAFPQATGYLNLSQVQGFADLQDATFENLDEGYMDDAKVEDSIEIDTSHLKSESTHTHYHLSSDEGLGASIKDEGSPSQSQASPQINHDGDGDADSESDHDDEIIVTSSYPDPEPDSDTEYTPRSSTRTTRKRPRTTKSTTSPTSKRTRVTKSQPKTSSKLACKSCPELPPFPNLNALQKHATSSHTRPFICVFHFAGCSSTFASKNEWKRHVSSQHLNLSYWCCTLGTCINNNGGTGSEFNRKDLFTQHLRRMHAPFAVKRQGKKMTEWEDRVRELQSSAVRERRKPPTRLGCCVPGCGSSFEGSSAWDERMEHVAKHLEKGGGVEQGQDLFLLAWAETQGVIERRGSTGWGLCGVGKEKGWDVDAEGEDE